MSKQEQVSLEDDGAQHFSLEIKRLLPHRRIDKYLQHRFPDFSRTLIQRLISEQAVSVDGRPVKPSYQLKAGDCVDLILPPPPTNRIEPESIPLDVLYEDEHLLAINKQDDLIASKA